MIDIELLLDELWEEEVSTKPRFVASNRFISSQKFYCPQCAKDRHMMIYPIECAGVVGNHNGAKVACSYPSIVTAVCEQCPLRIAVLLYYGPDLEPRIACFPNMKGGIATAATPPELAHFLDQAFRSHSVGAYGAALAMYRASLEQLLDLQNYKQDMLKKKIDAVELDIKNGTGPAWVAHIDATVMDILRKLGNEIIHPTISDRLQAVDADTVQGVIECFQYLLFAIYDLPNEHKERLAQLMGPSAGIP